MTLVESDAKPSQSADNVDDHTPLSEPPDVLPSFEEILDMTTVEALRPVTRTVLETRFAPEDIDEALIGFELMADLHRGRYRRSGAEEGTHPTTVGLWHVVVNPDATVDEYVAAVLHDTGEDCGQNEESIRTHLTERGYPKHRAPHVARAVEALTRADSDGQQEYINKMVHISPEIPQIRIIPIKALDTAHNVVNYAREVHAGEVDPERARNYLRKKVDLVVMMAQIHAPDAPNTKILRDTSVGLTDELAIRGQRDQFAIARRRPATIRVPA